MYVINLMLLLKLICGSLLPDGPITSVECLTIFEEVDAIGWSQDSWKSYCKYGCNFESDIECQTKATKKPSWGKVDIGIELKALYDKSLGDDVFVDDAFDFNYDRIMDYISYFPSLLAIGLVGSASAAVGSRRYWFVVISAMLGIGGMVVVDVEIQSIAVSSFVILLLLANPGANNFTRMTASFAFIIIGGIMIPFFVRNVIVDVMSLLGVLIISSLLLYKSFESKNAVDVLAIVPMLLIIFLSVPSIKSLIAQRAGRSVVGMFIMLSGSILLPYGKYKVFTFNLFSGIAGFSKYLDSQGITISYQQFLLLGFSYVVLYFALRAALGCGVIYKTKAKIDMQMFIAGFLIYVHESVYAPMNVLRQFFFVLFEGKKFNRVVFGYSVTFSILNFFEYYYAREIFFVRAVFSCLDMMFEFSGIGKFARLCDFKIDLQGMSFPKMNSFPWVDTKTLSMISDSVCRIVADGKKGCGLIVKDARGMLRCYTVNHVIRDADHLMINDKNANLDVDFFGKGVDPVVSLKITGFEGVPVKMLSNIEISSVQLLCVLGEDDKMVVIEDFSFKGNDIEAVVDLKSGDSGSPVVAVLNNGTLRYAGAVSRGSFSEGQGNFISSVVPENRIGSPGMKDTYEDFEAENEVERRTVLHISDLLRDNNVKSLRVDDDKTKKKFKDSKKKARERLNTLLDVMEADDELRDDVLKKFNDNDVIDFNVYRGRFVRQRRF